MIAGPLWPPSDPSPPPVTPFSLLRHLGAAPLGLLRLRPRLRPRGRRLVRRGPTTSVPSLRGPTDGKTVKESQKMEVKRQKFRQKSFVRDQLLPGEEQEVVILKSSSLQTKQEEPI